MLGFFGFRLFRFLPLGLALALGSLVALTILRFSGYDKAASVNGAVASASAPALKADIQPQPAADRALEMQALKPIRTAVTVADGDTLLDLLMHKGIDRTVAASAVDALRPVYNPRSLKSGSRVELEFGVPQSGSKVRPLQMIVLNPEPGRRVTVSRNGDGFAATANRLPEIRDVAHYAGTIKSSLFESASAQGVPPQVLSEMIHAFSYDVDFQRDLQPGDTFEVLYQRTLDSQGDVLRAGDIDYAELALFRQTSRHLSLYPTRRVRPTTTIPRAKACARRCCARRSMVRVSHRNSVCA